MHSKTYLILALSLMLTACYQTETGLVLGHPDYEKQTIRVTAQDLAVLQEAKSLLSNSENWAKDSKRECQGGPPYNLYCALERASIAITGQYIHRRPALQEVRFVIDDRYKDRWQIHRLGDFNGHEKTTHTEVIEVIDTAANRIKFKLSQYDDSRYEKNAASK